MANLHRTPRVPLEKGKERGLLACRSSCVWLAFFPLHSGRPFCFETHEMACLFLLQLSSLKGENEKNGDGFFSLLPWGSETGSACLFPRFSVLSLAGWDREKKALVPFLPRLYLLKRWTAEGHLALYTHTSAQVVGMERRRESEWRLKPHKGHLMDPGLFSSLFSRFHMAELFR